MDPATRQVLVQRRDGLMAQNNRLRADIRAREHTVISDTNFDPTSRCMDDHLARLLRSQDELIGHIQEIDRQLSR